MLVAVVIERLPRVIIIVFTAPPSISAALPALICEQPQQVRVPSALLALATSWLLQRARSLSAGPPILSDELPLRTPAVLSEFRLQCFQLVFWRALHLLKRPFSPSLLLREHLS